MKMRPSEVEMRSDWFNKALTASTRGRCATELMFRSVDAGDGEGGSGTWAGGGTDDEAIGWEEREEMAGEGADDKRSVLSHSCHCAITT